MRTVQIETKDPTYIDSTNRISLSHGVEMIVEYLRYTIEDTRQDAFKVSYKTAAESLTRSPYCKAYELCQCVEDSSQFIIRIEWTSAEDHLNRFRKSTEFKNFIGHVKEYIKDIQEMQHYHRIESQVSP